MSSKKKDTASAESVDNANDNPNLVNCQLGTPNVHTLIRHAGELTPGEFKVLFFIWDRTVAFGKS